MRLSKSQLAVITILNVLIAALVAAFFWLPHLRAKTDGENGGITPPPDDTTVTTPPDDVHKRLREASAGRVQEIASETRLMGSGDETVVAAYFAGDILYVFGNATVGDYDFDDYGGFLCKLDPSGKIIGYEYFNGRMTAVGVVEGGYAVATLSDAGTTEERARLYFVAYAGQPQEVGMLAGEACDIITVSVTKVAIVTKGGTNSVRLTEYAVGGTTWAAERSTNISSGYSLEFMDCYQLGDEYIIAARASSLPRYDSIAFFSFRAGGDPTTHFYGGTEDSLLTPYAILPYEQGYVMLCRRNGVASIVSVDYTFKTYRRDMLGFAFDTAKLVYAGGKYYACFDDAGSVRIYELDSTMQTRKNYTGAEGAMPDIATSGKPSFMLAKTPNSTLFTEIDGNRKIFLDIKNATVHAARFADGRLTVVLSATGGTALSAPTGGRDVYVIQCVIHNS